MTQPYHSWAYIRRNVNQDTTETPMFIALLFKIGKLWNQLRHPSANEWIKKIWYIHTISITWP
jgi:hypothetical protein